MGDGEIKAVDLLWTWGADAPTGGWTVHVPPLTGGHPNPNPNPYPLLYAVLSSVFVLSPK